jgi:hypothetical protein
MSYLCKNFLTYSRYIDNSYKQYPCHYHLVDIAIKNKDKYLEDAQNQVINARKNVHRKSDGLTEKRFD